MPELKGDHPQSSVYVEVAIPTENGERVVFYTEEYTTDELDVRAIHKMLANSEKAVIDTLHLRHRPM